MKFTQILKVDGDGFIALSEDGNLYHIYQIINMITNLTEWGWSRIDIDI